VSTVHRSFVSLVVSAGLVTGLGGCSLVWQPVVDPEPDAYFEEPDAYFTDVPPEPDAGPDAFVVIPDEVCDGVGGDEDMDSLADCNDPDCFGDDSCCDPTVGTDYGAMFSGMTLPPEWSDRDLARSYAGTALQVGVAGSAPVGTLWRNRCVPLGQGGHFELRVGRRGPIMVGSGETMTLVLSPAREPGPSGFLDELAIRIDAANRATVLRAGTAITLDDAPCVMSNVAQLGPETTFQIDLRPGVSGGRSAILASVAVTSSDGMCRSTSTLVHDLPILADDLVRTPEDGTRSCQDSPGLYFGVEVRPPTTGAGTFAIVPLTAGPASIVLRPLECASPGVFSRSTVVLDRESVGPASAPHTLGGIGAPDLLPAPASQWALAYDASVEDRSEELFRALTLSLGVGFGAVPDSDTWMPTPTSPIEGTGARVREPSLTMLDVTDPVLLWARETSGSSGDYEIARGTFDPVGRMLTASTIISPSTGPEITCESLREPSMILGYSDAGAVDGEWIFVRCDVGAVSRLGLWRRSSGTTMLVSPDVLGDSAIASRVIAADALSTLRPDGRVFALWVLARGATDTAEVHLFLADRVPAGVAPTFVPYPGNPILREGDGSLASCPTGSTCRLTSMSVAQVRQTGADRLRFLFARARTGGTPVYDLLGAEQVALRGLEGM
jgi:hypothetical protein